MEADLTVVGLGPGVWDMLTIEAVEVMRTAREVWVRTAIHPTLAPIRQRLTDVTFHSFDHLYDTLPTFGEVYDRIVDELRVLAGRSGGVGGDVGLQPAEQCVGMLTATGRFTEVFVGVPARQAALQFAQIAAEGGQQRVEHVGVW